MSVRDDKSELGDDPVFQWLRARERGENFEAPVHAGSARLDEAYSMGPLLGHGAFGHVHRATHKLSGTTVAVKAIPVSRGSVEGERLLEQSITREIETMRRLSHPHIISLIEAFAPPPREAAQPNPPAPRVWHIVLELCAGRDLQQLVDRQGALELGDVRVIAAQLCSALQHMHEHGVVHRDIKPDNVMVLGAELGGVPVVKVLDFGLAYGLDEEFVDLYRAAIAKAKVATPVSRKAPWAENVRRVFAQPTSARGGGQGEASDSVHGGSVRGGSVRGSSAHGGSRRGSRRGSSRHGGSRHSAAGQPREMESALALERDASRHVVFAAEPAGSRAYAPPEVRARLQTDAP